MRRYWVDQQYASARQALRASALPGLQAARPADEGRQETIGRPAMIHTIKHLRLGQGNKRQGNVDRSSAVISDFPDTVSGIENLDGHCRNQPRLDATGWLIAGFVAGVILTNGIWLVFHH
jgi:hypothetical protein